MAAVLILGLRRSGTTALWRCFQQLPDFVGLDEPFNPKLRHLPRDHPKGTLDDLFVVVDRDPTAFSHMIAPIDPSEECEPSLTERQSSYLAWLVEQSEAPHLVVDETRCGFKAEQLAKAIHPDVVIHLSRDPEGWIRSHLLPSEKGLSYARQRCRSNLTRLRSRRLPRDYSLDKVGRSTAFRNRLREHGVSAAQFEQFSAAKKLYMMWLLHENDLAVAGRELWGDRYHFLVYADFVADPEKHLCEALAIGRIDAPSAAVTEACRHVRRFRYAGAALEGSSRIRSVIADVDLQGLASLESRLLALHTAATDD